MKRLFTAVFALLIALLLVFAFTPQESQATPYTSNSDVLFVEETDTLDLALEHDGLFIVNNSEEPTVSIYVPQDSDVAFPIGTEIRFAYGLVGLQTVFTCHENVYLIKSNDSAVFAQGGVVTLKKIDYNTWVLFGDLEPTP